MTLPAEAPLPTRLVAIAMTATNVMYAGVLLVMRYSGILHEHGMSQIEEPLRSTLISVFIACGVLAAGASAASRSFIRSLILAADPSQSGRYRAVVIPMAIADLPGILGFLLGVMTGDVVWAIVLIGVSFVTCLYHYPSREWIAGAPITGNRR